MTVPPSPLLTAATPTWTGALSLSAAEIAVALLLPPPTGDQTSVIEAPPIPALVIAGAGSGKTETMASRVVWLVANGHVRRDEVLGLTFTRKAAGELAERIDARLARIDEYARRGLLAHLPTIVPTGRLQRLAEETAKASARARQSALTAVLDELAAAHDTGWDPARSHVVAVDTDFLLRPRVSTYNAFADGIVREHAARIGRDPDASLMSQSASWLLARSVVIGSEDDRLSARSEAFSTVIDAVQSLAGAVLDNRADIDEVARFGERMAAAVEPFVNPTLQNPGDVEKMHNAMTGLPVLADLVRAYARAKELGDTSDFADQVAGALEIVTRAPEVADELREQYRVILLDEYQDTSVIQTELLAHVFHDSAVMAVGDPNQAIYAWRGASADNLPAFPGAFARAGGCATYALMISWRNDRSILDAANRLIRTPVDAPSRLHVPPLQPRPGAAPGFVQTRFALTIDEEAAAVAEWFVDVRSRHATDEIAAAAARAAQGEAAQDPRAHSGAILFRAKRHMQTFSAALTARGVPNRILGLGGLLGTPEVVDVVAALRVIHDPSQGSSLIRLLVGPRWGIGVADMAALHDLADTLSQRDGTLSPLSDDVRARIRGSAGIDEQLSIIDALEFVRTARDDYRLLENITAEGRERLREAGDVFDRLRRAAGQPIAELIRQIELELRLDIELPANETRGPARVASAQLRAFLDEVRAFLDADERGSIGNLLAWLDHAEDTDELMPRPVAPEPGVVQLLTIHGAKGLEWDAVAVVRLVSKELPKAPRTTQGWIGFGGLPYRFRGDRDALTDLAWAPAPGTTRGELVAAIKDFKQANADYQAAEERRLAYVAVTRARGDLLLTGSQWGGQKEAREPSVFLTEVVEELGLEPIVLAEAGENPYLDRGGVVLTWPLDPLGARRPLMDAAVASVTEAYARAAAGEGEAATPELEALLRERAARAAKPTVDPPMRIPASTFKDYVTDFSGTVRGIARPMPERPFRQTRLGTLFHAWVEHRSGLVGVGASLDDALWEIDDESPSTETEASVADAADMARLQAIFERSEWADLKPLEVEAEIDYAFTDNAGASHVIICKLDAVYRRESGRIEIVDWKTGRPPRTAAERSERMLQLALYRIAYHKARGVPLDQIDATLFYVGDDLVLRGEFYDSEADLDQRWNAARDARSASPAGSSSSSESVAEDADSVSVAAAESPAPADS